MIQLAKTFSKAWWLTTGSDIGAAFTGTSGNDVFTAGVTLSGNTLVDTLQNIDQLNGGAGNDTLNTTLNGGILVTPTLTSVETVNLRVTAANGGIDLAAATGVTAINVNSSTALANVQNTGAAALGVANQNTAVTFGGSTATALTLNLDTVGTAATDIAINIGTAKANAATSFVINAKDAHVTLAETIVGAATTSATVAATGANEITFAAADLASLTTLTVTGAGTADFTGAALSALTTLTAGDGGVKVTGTSAAANALTATTGAGADTLVFNAANVKSITTGAGDDAVTLNTAVLASTATVSLGDGNDTLTLSGAPAAGATINGGAGTDTFATTIASYNTVSSYTAAQRALISNFEVLSITDTLVNGAAVDVSSLTGVGSFTAAAGVVAGGNATVTKLGASSTVTIAGANTGVVGSAGTNEKATFTFADITAAAGGTSTLTINGITVTVAAGQSATATEIANAFASGISTGSAVVSGTPIAAYTSTSAGAVATYTAVAVGNPTNLASVAGGTGTAPAAVIPVVVDGTAAAAPAAAGSLTAVLAVDTAADALTLVLNNNYVDNNNATIDNLAVSNKFVAAEVETLTVNATGKMGAIVTKVDGYKADLLTNTLDLSGSNKLVAVNVTGDQALNFSSTADMTKLATIDASANTGGLTFNGAAADMTTATTSVAMTIKGSATAANSLTGSGHADTIIGGSKVDTITGGKGGDTLTGNGGNDKFVFAAGDSSIGTGKFDTITDFVANTKGAGAAGVLTIVGATGVAAADLTGDVLSFKQAGTGAGGVVVDVLNSAADASTFLANNKSANAVIAALDSTNNNLYVDNTGDGVADFFIHLTGVTTLNTGAFELVA